MSTSDWENEGREPGDVSDDADALPDVADAGPAAPAVDLDEAEAGVRAAPDDVGEASENT